MSNEVTLRRLDSERVDLVASLKVTIDGAQLGPWAVRLVFGTDKGELSFTLPIELDKEQSRIRAPGNILFRSTQTFLLEYIAIFPPNKLLTDVALARKDERVIVVPNQVYQVREFDKWMPVHIRMRFKQ